MAEQTRRSGPPVVRLDFALLALCARFHRAGREQQRCWDSGGGLPQEPNAAWWSGIRAAGAQWIGAMDQITGTPAVTSAGLRAKAEALQSAIKDPVTKWPIDHDKYYAHERLALSLADDVLAAEDRTMGSSSRRAAAMTATPMTVTDEAHRPPGILHHPDADLIALCAQFDALGVQHRQLYAQSTAADDETIRPIGNHILDCMSDLVDAMAVLEATTSDGILARAHNLAEYAGHGKFSFDHPKHVTGRLLAQLLRDAAEVGKNI